MTNEEHIAGNMFGEIVFRYLILSLLKNVAVLFCP